MNHLCLVLLCSASFETPRFARLLTMTMDFGGVKKTRHPEEATKWPSRRTLPSYPAFLGASL